MATNPYYLIECLNITNIPKTVGNFCPNRLIKENIKGNLTGIYADERRLACCDKEGWLDVWDFAKVRPPLPTLKL
ncbi:hypothetical protein [Candidatus Protochlamydia sp. W-9]|uniref:hypothetical protein n=1 Tax=Candidatus Protochlamydia sp. W-9 TaxID=1785087 RepID=UPI000A9C1712|nr:hypothetical protein [Candidatus Protochlamydia sp. W-9]